MFLPSSRISIVRSALLFTALISSLAFAQGGPGGPGGPGGGRGGPGGFGGPGGPGGGWRMDPAEMRQRTIDRIDEALDVSDEEWKTLAPKVEAFVDARMKSGMMRGFRGGPPPEEDKSPIAQATRDLDTAANDTASTDEQLAAKIAALRQAREQAKAELTKAQDELRQALKARQEAKLLVLGMLD